MLNSHSPYMLPPMFVGVEDHLGYEREYSCTCGDGRRPLGPLEGREGSEVTVCNADMGKEGSAYSARCRVVRKPGSTMV
jgi:hypothetical protein